MGNTNSRYINELSDDSSESESDYVLEPRSRISLATSTSTEQMRDDVRNVTASVSHMKVNAESQEEFAIRDTTIDASAKSFILPEPKTALTIDNVHRFEQDLDNYEIVSLVYLLYENPHFALQELTLLLGGAQKYLVYDWANKENNSGKLWQKKLIEAFCIIKNYKVLRELGYQKQNVNADFLPHRITETSLINRLRKAIYLICEKLNAEKTSEFLTKVKLNFQEKNLPFDSYSSEFLELYFLKWEIMGYVSLTNITNIKRVLKVMNEEFLYDMLCAAFPEAIQNSSQTEIRPGLGNRLASQGNQERKKPPQNERPSTSTDTQQHASVNLLQFPLRFTPQYMAQEDYQFSPPCTPPSSSRSLGHNNALIDEDRYETDPENPGILLIINQEYFYSEINPKFKHLLPEDSNIKLEARDGTEKDEMALKRVFGLYGFKVVSAASLNHEHMVTKIKEVVKSVRNESSLFVCIMSHGDKGVVYGSNSCKVEVSTIQDIMCNTNEHLVGKPKVLILQSCQGKECQKVDVSSNEEEDKEEEEANSMTTDGPKKKRSLPRIVDIFTFWATVPGYAAIRNKRTGSWFIQALCDKIEKYGNRLHFADICTRVVKSVTERRWAIHPSDINAMTPSQNSTFRKDFYFPPMKKSNEEPQQFL